MTFPADAVQFDDRQPRNLAKAAGVFFVYVIVGPPLGGFLALGFFVMLEHRPLGVFDATSFEEFEYVLRDLVKIVIAAYFFAGLQAAAMGLVGAVSQYFSRRQRVPLIPVLLMSLASGAIALVIFAQPMSHPPPDPTIASAFIAVHFGIGIGGWLAANWLLSKFWPRQARMVSS